MRSGVGGWAGRGFGDVGFSGVRIRERIGMLLHELSSPAFAALDRSIPVVLPIAALEQHGRHLPLFTDSILAGEVARRAEEALGGEAVFGPVMWLGNSHHHLDHAGTLSAEPRAYLDLLGSMLENLLVHGFRRVVFLNGHGGNMVPSAQAVFEARQRRREVPGPTCLSLTYWTAGPSPKGGAGDPGLLQDRMGHACEWETSMMLRLRPDLVGPLGDLEDVSQEEPHGPASWGWVMPERSEAGHIGSPGRASAEKGEYLLRTFSGHVADRIRALLRDGARYARTS